MNEPNAAWRCDECGEIYRDEDDANECCQPRVSEGFAHAVYGAFHRDREESVACCGHIDLGGDGCRQPTAEELEAAGQTRLLP